MAAGAGEYRWHRYAKSALHNPLRGPLHYPQQTPYTLLLRTRILHIAVLLARGLLPDLTLSLCTAVLLARGLLPDASAPAAVNAQSAHAVKITLELPKSPAKGGDEATMLAQASAVSAAGPAAAAAAAAESAARAAPDSATVPSALVQEATEPEPEAAEAAAAPAPAVEEAAAADEQPAAAAPVPPPAASAVPAAAGADAAPALAVTEAAAATWEAALPFTLTLDVDFASIGDHEAFKQDLIRDVAAAGNLDPKYVKIAGLRAGSVIVDVLIAPEAGEAAKIVESLKEQAGSPTSRLRQGKLTSKTKGLTTAPANGAPAVSADLVALNRPDLEGRISSNEPAGGEAHAPAAAATDGAAVQELEEKLEAAQDELDTLKFEHAKLIKDSAAHVAELEQEIEELKDKLEGEQFDHAKFRKDSMAHVAELEKDLANLRQEFDGARQACRELEATLEKNGVAPLPCCFRVFAIAVATIVTTTMAMTSAITTWLTLQLEQVLPSPE